MESNNFRRLCLPRTWRGGGGSPRTVVVQALWPGRAGLFLLVWLAGWIGGTASLIAAPPAALPPPPPPGVAGPRPEVGPVPTPQTVVDKMLEMAQIGPGDVVYDLGCGDGRILVTAAKKYGVKAVGFDIDPVCVRESRSNAIANGVAHLVTVNETDIFKVDLSPASVVTMYLLPQLNVRLMPQLEKLKPGSRIISHDFDMRGAAPSEVHRMTAFSEFPKRLLDQFQSGAAGLPPLPPPASRTHTIFKWIVPWTKDSGALTVAPSAPPAP